MGSHSFTPAHIAVCNSVVTPNQVKMKVKVQVEGEGKQKPVEANSAL